LERYFQRFFFLRRQTLLVFLQYASVQGFLDHLIPLLLSPQAFPPKAPRGKLISSNRYRDFTPLPASVLRSSCEGPPPFVMTYG